MYKTIEGHSGYTTREEAESRLTPDTILVTLIEYPDGYRGWVDPLAIVVPGQENMPVLLWAVAPPEADI